jgi:pimeloyl-ACP methyl ester carboxylesterase
MTHSSAAGATVFIGAHGNKLAADRRGETGTPVLLLHGGGQTRHAWRKTAERLAHEGFVAYAVDQRGHGDSEWVAGGHYAYDDFAADAAALADAIAARHGARPVVIGASLGGMAALWAEGAAHAAGRPPLFSALVLVDITPKVDPEGVNKVQGFMRLHAQEGFASIEDAAEAVAAYLPHRPRPRSHDGLRKNLRFHADGRWRWHWDPRFLDGPRPIDRGRGDAEAMLSAAARALTAPTLLVRGASSELVGEEHARDFLALTPHARFVDVAGARHMVAGDRNDHFADAILEFLRTAGPEMARAGGAKTAIGARNA